MSELREQGLTGDELREEAMGTRAEYEEILAEQHEKASERFAELHEDVQSTGYSLLDLEGLIKRNPSNPAGADAAGADAAGAGSASAAATSCRRCHRTGVEMSPVSDVGLWKDVAGGINGTGGAGGAGGGGQLCYVCAAEAELDARQPLASKHGQVVPRGASGFSGWTKGLRRTSDKAALKKMYAAYLPSTGAGPSPPPHALPPPFSPPFPLPFAPPFPPPFPSPLPPPFPACTLHAPCTRPARALHAPCTCPARALHVPCTHVSGTRPCGRASCRRSAPSCAARAAREMGRRSQCRWTS